MIRPLLCIIQFVLSPPKLVGLVWRSIWVYYAYNFDFQNQSIWAIFKDFEATKNCIESSELHKTATWLHKTAGFCLQLVGVHQTHSSSSSPPPLSSHPGPVFNKVLCPCYNVTGPHVFQLVWEVDQAQIYVQILPIP